MQHETLISEPVIRNYKDTVFRMIFKQKQPARRELRLSDAYIHSEAEPQLELIVTQLNINPGYNDELMEKCPTLRDYMLYVDRVREHQKTMSLKEAVGRAVDECIKDGILADFLKKNKEQVISMSIFEYDEKLHEETMREIGREEGRIEGKAVGRAEGEAAERATNISRSIASLRATPLTEDQIAEHLVNTFDLTIEQAKQCMQDAESK